MRVKINPTDKLFSQYMRLKSKGICERCGQYKGYTHLQVSHFHGRRKRNTRWDEENCCVLCMGCHMYLHANPSEHVKFFQERLGQQAFDKLNIRAQFRHKVDEPAVILYLREKLKELEL